MLGGAVWGVTRRTPAEDAARLADRAWGLDDRVATALDWARREDRTPLVDALIADAAARVERLEPRRVVRRILPADGRYLPAPLALAVVLALAPAVPMPSGLLPDFSAGEGDGQEEARIGTPLMEDRARPAAAERL